MPRYILYRSFIFIPLALLLGSLPLYSQEGRIRISVNYIDWHIDAALMDAANKAHLILYCMAETLKNKRNVSCQKDNALLQDVLDMLLKGQDLTDSITRMPFI